MSDTCLFPLCNSHAEKNGYCIGHGKYYSNSSGEIKMPKAVNKESDSMKDIKKELKKAYPIFLKKHPFCEVKMEGCTRVATCIHHVRSRIGKQVFEKKDWKASCSFCNLEIERKDALAREMGVKKSKFNKN